MILSSATALASVVSYVELHADPAMIVDAGCAVASIAIFTIGIRKFGRRGFWLAIPTIITLGATGAVYLVFSWAHSGNFTM
jgi:hypothetical protein